VSHSKKYLAARQRVEARRYELREAIDLIRDIKYAKFDETVEIAMRLGVDPRHADQMVRGTVVLPHGTGRSKKVLVVAVGDQAKEAQEAGADSVMGEEVVAKIQEGWLDFEAMVATPDMMRHLSKLGKILGPRGLMPNPKTGTVTTEVAKAVREIKAGKVEFRVDKTAIIHAPVGKTSFTADALEANARSLITAILRAKPATSKGKYVQSAFMSSTMGPGVALDLAALEGK
jgi:large subunit ribosomal protein L1